MVKQYGLKQRVDQADWLVGNQLIGKNIHGKALYSLAGPGTAYDDPVLGKDSQAANMKHYVRTDLDNGGVHINAGILNHAFYLAATALGGFAWERVGKIWYETMLDNRLKPKAQFKDFARVTHDNERRLYGVKSEGALAVQQAWKKSSFD